MIWTWVLANLNMFLSGFTNLEYILLEWAGLSLFSHLLREEEAKKIIKRL